MTLVTLVTMNRGPFRSRRAGRRDAGILGLDPIELPAGNKRVTLDVGIAHGSLRRRPVAEALPDLKS